MDKKDTVILGAGITGLTAAHILSEKNLDYGLYEKEEAYGGLCRSFTIEGFTFDTFSHTSFSKDPYVMSVLEEGTEFHVHLPEAVNYYKGQWVRNPVQTNLIDLSIEERIKIINDFIRRPQNELNNYDDWLRAHYGDYFTDHFPALYTRKYWTVEPKELEVNWVKNRMYTPTLDEVLYGAMSKNTPIVHYTKENHYPKHGGIMAFLSSIADNTNLYLNKEVNLIDTVNKYVRFSDGSETAYEHLISTLPLDVLINGMTQVPESIMDALDDLDCTSGLIVSLGLRGENKIPTRWLYVYDECMYPSRIYAPNLQSQNNVPDGCYALQAEIYYSKHKPLEDSIENITEKTICQLEEMGLIDVNEIIVKDVKEIKYANVMFTPQIYAARDKIHEFLKQRGIIYAGRFGEWDYLWMDQCILSAKTAVEKII